MTSPDTETVNEANLSPLHSPQDLHHPPPPSPPLIIIPSEHSSPSPSPPILSPSTSQSPSPSPAPARTSSPFHTSPNRTTSHVSTVSVETHPRDSGSPRRRRGAHPVPSSLGHGTGASSMMAGMVSSPLASPSLQAPATAAGSIRSSAASSINISIDAGTGTPASGEDPGRVSPSSSSSSTSPSPSRKGKERAVGRGAGNGPLGGEGQDMIAQLDRLSFNDEDRTAELVDAALGDQAAGQVVQVSGDARLGLRELVRRSTVGDDARWPGTASAAASARSRAASRAGSIRDVYTLDVPPDRTYTPRRYYVLTHAGKPVFASSHDDDEADDNLTNMMGVVSALISIFAEDDDRLRTIVKGRYRIGFVLRSPLYLFCVSDWGEPEHVLKTHLEYIYLQILSVVSSTQLSRAFQRRSNFDLSRLLEGNEAFLHNLINQCQDDFSFLTSTLQPLRMSPSLRDTAAAALMPPAKFKDLLYVLLIAGGRIVTLLRPRKHSIHPSDMHLLLNTLATSATLRSSETWLPICLPKFNPAGFVHAYVSYVLDDVGLVFVSADREAFEPLRGWREIVVEHLKRDGALDRIEQSIPAHPYSVSAIGCPGLRHFIYKSRQHIQLTSPIWEAPYTPNSADRKRLITHYQQLHDAIHARSGQSSPLKLVYMRTDHEACLAWLTKPFELYIAVSPHLSKSAVVSTANSVAKWVAAEESRLFLKDAPVF